MTKIVRSPLYFLFLLLLCTNEAHGALRVSSPAQGTIEAISYGADPTGIVDSTSAINQALSTLINGIYPTVHLPSGNYKISNALALQGGQCLYGDGDHSTFLQIGAGFSPSALGVTVLSGQETNSPCIHDFGFAFAVPPGLTTTTSAAQASGTTIQVNSAIPVNYYVDDTTTTTAIPALTYVTATSGTGPFTLTLSATVTGVLNGDTIKANPTRNSFAPLGTCTTGSGGTGCQYPPAVYGVAGGRPRIWNIYVGGAWAGFDFTGGSTVNVVPSIDNISMGALSYGFRLDGSLDTSHVVNWHEWEFGHTGNDSNNAWHDGQTIGMQLGRTDGYKYSNISFFDSRLILTSNASNAIAPSTWSGVLLDGNGANLEIAGGISNIMSNVYRTGSSGNANCPINVSGGTTHINNIRLDSGGSSNYVCVTAGTLKIVGGVVAPANGTISTFSESGGLLDVEGVYFNLPSTISTAVIAQSAGTVIVKGNTCHGGTSGTFVSIAADASGTDIEGNNCQGYSYTLPAGNTSGYYNASGNYALQGASALTQNWWRTGNATNQKGWQEIVGGGSWNLIALSDAGAGTAGSGNTGNVVNVNRSAQAITDLGFGNTVDNPTFHFNSTGLASWGPLAPVALKSAGSKFALSGTCTTSASTGGATWGIITLSSNNCTLTVSMGSSQSSTNGWTCPARDRSNSAGLALFGETSSTTTSVNFAISASAVSGDVISFGPCVGY